MRDLREHSRGSQSFTASTRAALIFRASDEATCTSVPLPSHQPSMPQAFGEGRLEGVRLHWGVATGEHRQWLPAPAGWLSDPAEHLDAGEHVP